MSKGNTTENDWVKFVANAAALPSYGANLYFNLHTADPGEDGTAATNVATYTGYAAVVVARDGSGWVICDADGTVNVSGSAFKNALEVTFPECTGVPDDELETHGSISTISGQILYSGALTAAIRVTNLITPRFPAGTAIFKED